MRELKKHRNKNFHSTKYIFVTGGVVSSIGKGLAAASIGALLETRGLRVTMTKMDPYINVDPGTMSPFQHGEVFVTDDGAETDLDLGHYQRFTNAHIQKKNSFTTGQVYDTVISRERRGDYLGGTVQVIPHITDQIKLNILSASENTDVSIVEIGGTVGDIESLPFLEAIRQFRQDVGKENALFIHLTLLPYIKAAGELKTKPTQHSVKELLSIGIQPDILICRSELSLDDDIRSKIARFCNVEEGCVFESLDAPFIYKMPLIYHDQKLDEKILDLLNIWTPKPNLDAWVEIVKRLENPKDTVRIALVGKYVGLKDSYKSVYEALTHGGIANSLKVETLIVDSETLTSDSLESIFKNVDGILVPGGFGNRGIDGKILAIQYAREHKIPFFGICLGMQMAAIEFARHVLHIPQATSEEFSEDPHSPWNVIHIMKNQLSVTRKGGTMRLGAYDCLLLEDSRALKAYNFDKITERHRHRYEFNNSFRSQFESKGMIISGKSPDGELVEIMEIPDHPWFLGCQFHPELKSRPTSPHPLFKDFIHKAFLSKKSALKNENT